MVPRKLLFIIIFFILALGLNGQRVINIAFPESGEIQLAENISIPKIPSGYTLWLPKSDAPKGMVVFFHSRRDTIKTDFFIRTALKKDLAIMYVTTDNRLEFFFDDNKMREVGNYILNACNSFNIPENNLLYAGMSLAGTRALKMHVFLRQNQEFSNIIPKGIVVCDSPIDMSRFYQSSVKAKERNCEPLSANEGLWVSEYLHTNLRGHPVESVARYNQYSPYSRNVRRGGNAPYFRDIVIRAYTEPDLQWWKENRCKGYRDINAYDLEGFINQLIDLGNDNAELIQTENKGFRPDGTRHPHSWSIVDEKELINWFSALIEN